MAKQEATTKQEDTKKIEFDQDMTIGQALALNPNAEIVFMGFGMHCISCFVSQMETIGEACEVHGVDVKEVIKELNNMPVGEKMEPMDFE